MAQRFEFNEEHDELEDMPLDYQEDDSDEDTDEKDEQGKDDGTSNTDKNTTQTDDTAAKGEIPQTGAIITSLFIILIISVASITFYVKYRKFRDI